MFRKVLRDLGWIEGRDIAIGSHYATGEAARTEALVREVIERQYDVILAATTPVVAALRQATRTVPIIFVNVSDPVGPGMEGEQVKRIALRVRKYPSGQRPFWTK